ncbi:globin family protein [Caenimonas aquaedulcis]|uniref:Hemin receptor n=1 Tax=Caenimonas aquaedulcis TaxID=2793270 RepID=A0A931MIY8_9BURK|nr:globin family protein [Caenimonas aquaedulcis]MBG9390527.1 hemin receptor [Caenimonas aquaedulcis]
MTPQQIELVQKTFAQVKPIAGDAAALFYARLFELDPSLRALFRKDMAVQGQMLMAMIGSAVASLRDLPRVVPVLRDMGARHAGYGVRDEHYATVGSALLWTLERGLGDAFTPEVSQAWAAAYAILSQTMIEGSRQAVAV